MELYLGMKKIICTTKNKMNKVAEKIKEVDELLESAMKRVVKNSNFSKKVLTEVVDEMLQEGYSKYEVLAHVNIIDIEYRT